MSAEPAPDRKTSTGGGSVAVRVRLFGIFRELAGEDGRETVVPSGSTAADLVAGLRRGGLDFLPERPTVAVNREYASLDHPLAAGDEVALIPPVAGGRA